MIETFSESEQIEELAAQLDPEIDRLYDRHIGNAKPWAVWEVIDFGQGTNFADKPWSPEDYPLPDGVRSAVYVNLLTEDNAPYYTNLLMSKTPVGSALQKWNGQWTMEEGQHSDAIRDWAHHSRSVDPKLLEDGRRVQMAEGQVPQPETLVDMLAYVPFQEKATQVAHHNTRRNLSPDDIVGRNVLKLVAADEGRHYAFYRDLAKEALARSPSIMMKAIAKQVGGFAMPGTGIPGFKEHAEKIADAGIYNGGLFITNVVSPTLEALQIGNLEGLDAEAERARDRLTTRVRRLGRAAAKTAPQ